MAAACIDLKAARELQGPGAASSADPADAELLVLATRGRGGGIVRVVRGARGLRDEVAGGLARAVVVVGWVCASVVPGVVVLAALVAARPELRHGDGRPDAHL